jgi:hypothetical protein
MLTKFRQWGEFTLVGLVILLIVYFIFFRPPKVVTLPGGETVKILDNSSFLKSIEQKLKGLDDLNKKVNDLESLIRQQNQRITEQEIPQALKETDIRKSVDRMRGAWSRD